MPAAVNIAAAAAVRSGDHHAVLLQSDTRLMYYRTARASHDNSNTAVRMKIPPRPSYTPILDPVSALRPRRVCVLLSAYPKARCTHFHGDML